MVAQDRPSKKQRELLSFIDGFIAGHGYGPSYREIMRALNYKSVSTVAVHVNGLIAKGLLVKRDRSARSLEVMQVSTSSDVKAHSSPSDTEEKWLVTLIKARFDDYDKKPTDKKRDDLFVLVGALSVLGFHDSASSLKARLLQDSPN